MDNMETRFQELLNESKKTYAFKIGIAGVLPEGCEESIKTCLQKYDVASISKGKKTPITERPLDFPQLENIYPVNFTDENNYVSEAFKNAMNALFKERPELLDHFGGYDMENLHTEFLKL